MSVADSSGTGAVAASGGTTADERLLTAVRNLARFHHDHERFYAAAPRETAVEVQRHARALQGLAHRWSTVRPEPRAALSPFEGCEDLNEPSALQLDGILFMEGEGRPAEIDGMVRWLRATAGSFEAVGSWLARAMESSWAVAASLVDIPALADVLGERHRIIANDWQAASMSSLVGRVLDRAADMLDGLDLSPTAVRADLAGPRALPARLYSISELLDHAADLAADSAGLVHDNERRWRTFRRAVVELVGEAEGG